MRNGVTLTVVGPTHALTKIIKEFGYAKDTGSETDDFRDVIHPKKEIDKRLDRLLTIDKILKELEKKK